MDIDPQLATNEKSELKYDLVAILFLTLTTIAFFAPLKLGGKTFYGRDITVLAHPMKYFHFKSYHQDYSSLWNPEIYSEIPCLSVMLGVALYPPNFYLSC